MGRLLRSLFAVAAVLAASVSGLVGAAASGLTWGQVQTQVPAGGQGQLTAVSCASASFCVAVGNQSGTAQPLLESWDGGTYRVTTLPTLSGATSSTLYGVSCTSTTFCVAVGSANLSGGGGEGLVYSFDGTTWSAPAVPAAAGWNAVSCSGSSFCQAVNGGQSLLWNGVSWSLQPMTGAYADSVSCPSPNFCMAAGWTPANSGGDVPVAQQWTGTAWTSVAIPSPTANSFLEGVSCPSVGVCTAVGYQGLASGADSTLVESFSNGTWTVVPSPNPSTTAQTPDNGLYAVSCTAASNCVAAGRYFGAGGYLTLVESWDGSAWTITPSPNPNTENLLQGVSCVSASWCMAVGYFGPVGTNMPLAEVGRLATTATSTSLASSLNPALVGQSVTYTATVQPQPDGGTVTFSDSGTAISGCGAVSLSSGTAACTVSYAAAGTHAISATYNGDLSFGSSVGSLTETVQAASTSTSVSSSLNPAILGQGMSFTATVAVSGDGTATGTMAFSADGSTLAGCGAVALTRNSAFCSTSGLGVGAHSIVATYSGDSATSASSGSLAENVGYAFALLYNSSTAQRAGSTLGIKVELEDAGGNDRSSASITVTGLCIVLQPATDCSAALRTVTQAFSFVAVSRKTAASYSLSLATKGLGKGSYNLVVSVAGDPVPHLAPFVLG